MNQQQPCLHWFKLLIWLFFFGVSGGPLTPRPPPRPPPLGTAEVTERVENGVKLPPSAPHHREEKRGEEHRSVVWARTHGSETTNRRRSNPAKPPRLATNHRTSDSYCWEFVAARALMATSLPEDAPCELVPSWALRRRAFVVSSTIRIPQAHLWKQWGGNNGREPTQPDWTERRSASGVPPRCAGRPNVVCGMRKPGGKPHRLLYNPNRRGLTVGSGWKDTCERQGL